MAKKDTDAYEKWLNEEFLGSIPDEKREAVKEALLSNEVAQGAFLRQQDYTRKTQELKTLQKEAEEAVKKAQKVDAYDKWYVEEAVPSVQRANDEANRLRAALVAAGITTETGTGNPPPPAVNPAKLNELEKRLNDIDSGAFNTIIGMSAAAYRAAKENFEFKPDEVMEYASRNRVSPVQAFEKLTETERATRAESARKDELKRAREEGAREALSKLHSPDYMKPTESSPVLDVLFNSKPGGATQQPSESDRVRAALAAFEEAGAPPA